MANTGEPRSGPQPTPVGRRVLSGSLDDVDIFSIAQFLVIQRKSGVLTISFGDARSMVWFDNGQIVSGRVPGASDGLEAIRKIFRWKQGAFEFAPTLEKTPVLIAADAQSLLMDLAIEADEMSRVIPRSDVAPPPVTAPPGGPPPVRPAMVRVVRPASPPTPPLAARVGSLPSSQVPEQPQYQRQPFSEEEFVRQIEERLVIEDTEFLSAPRHSFIRPPRKSAPMPKSLLMLAGLGIPVVLLVAVVIAWLATRTGSPPVAPSPAPVQPPAPAPTVAKDHKFITAPNAPARPVEKAIATLPLRCDLKGLDFDRRDVRQVNIILVREVAWDKSELAVAIAQDSIVLVPRVFDTQPGIDKVLITARTRLNHEPGQDKLDDAFRMTATRSVYLTIKPTYDLMSVPKIIEVFGGRFDKRLVGP